MSLFGNEMNTTVTVGQVSTGSRGGKTVDSTREISARVQLGTEKSSGPDGSAITRVDVLYTHDAISEDDVFWYDGATAPNIDEAQSPSNVSVSPDLVGNDTLYKAEF